MSRPFTEDSEGKEYFVGVLRREGFTNIVDTDSVDPYSHYDLEAWKDNNLYLFELKNRSFPSTRFGDITLSEDRYDYLRNSTYRTFLVYFFEDGWTIIDIKRWKPTGRITRTNKRTTRKGIYSDYRHTLVVWPIRQFKLLEY